MTVRAVILGLIVAVGLASAGYANDTWFFFSYIGGDLVPTHAFGLLLIGLILINPLLRLLQRGPLRWLGKPFAASEWVVMLALALMGSVLAGSAMFWQMPHPIITPIQEQATRPGWKKKDLLSYVPDRMMVERVFKTYALDHGIRRRHKISKETGKVTDQVETWREAVERYIQTQKAHVSESQYRLLQEQYKRLDAEDTRVIKGYMTGLERKPSNRALHFGEVPWKHWAPTLSFWYTVLALTFIAGACAVVIVHRQWAQREHLAYPIVAFTSELLATEPDGLINRIFRARAFWLGFGLSFLILLVNGYQKWNPKFISIPVGINLNAFRELQFVKTLMKVPNTQMLLDVKLYFSAVGIAYFLSSEASFSLGISGWLFALAAVPLVTAGVNMRTDMLGGGLPADMYFGAYLGMGLTVLYLGRRFYFSVLKRSVGLPAPAGEVLPREVWAGRILLLACTALVLVLYRVGLHPLLGVLFVGLLGLLFLMLARINAATGLFVIQPIWQPVSILVPLFGMAAIGPHAMMILAMLCIVISIDTRIAAVPLMANALKLADTQRLQPGRLAGWMAVAIIVAMVIALPVTVYIIYNFGVSGVDSAGTQWALAVARMPFNMLDDRINKLGDDLQAASQPTNLKRLLFEARSDRHFFTAVGLGLALVLTASYLRLRLPRWPLHPLMFLVWGTPWMTAYAPSFLMAWLLKSLLMTYGGQGAYRKARPFFVGLVAGEFIAAIMWGVVGVVYQLQTGTSGPHFLVRE